MASNLFDGVAVDDSLSVYSLFSNLVGFADSLLG